MINFDGTHFRISGAGRPAEYAVKMAQLPARQTLEALLAKQRISPELIEQLAGRLAAFHKQSIQVTDPTIRSYLRAACMENFRQVMPLAGRWLDAKSYDQVRAATLNYFIIYKHFYQFFNVKGIPLCPFNHHISQFVWDFIYFLENFRY